MQLKKVAIKALVLLDLFFSDSNPLRINIITIAHIISAAAIATIKFVIGTPFLKNQTQGMSDNNFSSYLYFMTQAYK